MLHYVDKILKIYDRIINLELMNFRKAPVEPKWDTHPSLMRRPSRVSRSNSSAAAYQHRDFRYQSPSPGPKPATAPCTPGTPGISPVMSRATSISSNVSDQIPQVNFQKIIIFIKFNI